MIRLPFLMCPPPTAQMPDSFGRIVRGRGGVYYYIFDIKGRKTCRILLEYSV